MSILPRTYSGSGKKEKVQSMFDSIAPKYDLLNTILSAGIDKRWRKKVVDILSTGKHEVILDVATGTADLAIEASRLGPKSIKGIDISEGMLALGREKVRKKNLDQVIELIHADSAMIPFGANTFDAVTVAFGIRNFEDLEKGLLEMQKVLKPGGSLIILEFSKPGKFPVKQLYAVYSRKIMPFIGNLFSRQRAAYEYLPESVETFPYGMKLVEKLNTLGYENTKWMPLTFGIASIYVAIKPKEI